MNCSNPVPTERLDNGSRSIRNRIGHSLAVTSQADRTIDEARNRFRLFNGDHCFLSDDMQQLLGCALLPQSVAERRELLVDPVLVNAVADDGYDDTGEVGTNPEADS